MTGKLVKLFFGVLLVCGSTLIAQAPVQNINPNRHPNLAAAQRLSAQAYQKIVSAQQANEWDLNGHAKQAEELLVQANQQLKMAAEASNQR